MKTHQIQTWKAIIRQNHFNYTNFAELDDYSNSQRKFI